MKLLSYQHKGQSNQYRIGSILNGKVIDIQQSYQLLMQEKYNQKIKDIHLHLPAHPSHFFNAGHLVIEKAKEAFMYISHHQANIPFIYEREEVEFGIPHGAPSKVICVGRNYADHAIEMKSKLPEYPVLFAKFNNALIGPEDAIEKSPYTKQLDYEVELVVVIGKKASFVKKDNAYKYIAGYTIGNDITARDLQKRTLQWLQGKSLNNSTPIGPWIITADEISEPNNLNVRSFVNGEKRQDSNTNKFIFNIPYLIEFISHLITLQPGDMIMTGTPDGVGIAMDPPQLLQAGDIVTSEIEKIGRLENSVVDGDLM